MVGFIRLSEFRELAVFPVKFAAVNNHSADLYSMSIHILACGVDHNVGAKLKGLAQDRGGKGIIHDQRNPHLMGNVCKLFNIKYL